MKTITRYNKAIVPAALTILFWLLNAAQTGEWSGVEVLEGALTTLLVYMIPNIDPDSEVETAEEV